MHFYDCPFLGTLAPFFRASESPIAIACLRLFTAPPLPPFPERRVPFFWRRTALSTLLPAALPYLRPLDFLREPELFRAAISSSQMHICAKRPGARRREATMRQECLPLLGQSQTARNQPCTSQQNLSAVKSGHFDMCISFFKSLAHHPSRFNNSGKSPNLRSLRATKV